ncbi:hypothetical protein BHM03_00053831, partial [Ensete ventricosum]
EALTHAAKQQRCAASAATLFRIFIRQARRRQAIFIVRHAATTSYFNSASVSASALLAAKQPLPSKGNTDGSWGIFQFSFRIERCKVESVLEIRAMKQSSQGQWG